MTANAAIDELIQAVHSGDPRATARVCRHVDERSAEASALLRGLGKRRAWRIGITGNPGAGKSTLADQLLTRLRQRNLKVGVVAIDPTSPFSGGALLGDRIRMQRHFEDAGVFIRSVATRGALGGLSRSAADIVVVLEAWGADIVLIETVGVGQDELEVTRSADTTLVVMVPGLGDDIQATKAGLLECADVFAVNKADRTGADSTVRDLQGMLALGKLSLTAQSPAAHTAHSAASSNESGADGEDWTPPIVKCSASKDDGVDDVLEALDAHRAWLETPPGQTRVRDRLALQLKGYLKDALMDAAAERLTPQIEQAVQAVMSGSLDLHSACESLVADFRAASNKSS